MSTSRRRRPILGAALLAATALLAGCAEEPAPTFTPEPAPEFAPPAVSEERAQEILDQVEEQAQDHVGAFKAQVAGPWTLAATVEKPRGDKVLSDHGARRELAQALADDAVVAWFQGRSEFGPRALGHRSLLADPRRVENLERLNDVKGREQFRPVAPMVLAERAADIFSDGPLPSPYMLFVHTVHPAWRDRIPAVVHVDGTARIQTIDDRETPRVAALLRAFEARTGLPVVVNTSLNTAGRPMVDDPRDALELFGSAPVDALVLGPHLVRRGSLFDGGRAA